MIDLPHPSAAELVYLLFGALVGSLVTHWLRRSSETSDRLRAARVTLRKLIDQARDESGFDIFSAHRDFVPVIFEMKHGLPDDLRWWKRRRFACACNAFISIPGDDLAPRVAIVTPGVQRTPEQKRSEDEAFQKPGETLVKSLSAILATI